MRYMSSHSKIPKYQHLERILKFDESHKTIVNGLLKGEISLVMNVAVSVNVEYGAVGVGAVRDISDNC